MSKPIIIVDTREKTPFVFPEDDWCAGSIIQGLKYGDYSISGLENILVLERKASVAEIHGNMTHKSFPKYIENIKDFPYKYIVCEFDIDQLLAYPFGNGLPKAVSRKIRIRGQYLLSYLLKISIDYNINIIFAGCHKNAQKISYQLLKKIYEKECLKTSLLKKD